MAEITERVISEEITKDGVTIAEISINHPHVSCQPTRIAKRINAFYEHQAKSLLRRAKKTVAAAAYVEHLAALETSAVFIPMTLTSSYTVTYNDEHVLSLYRDTIVRSGNTLRAQTRLGDTWCLSTGWFLAARTFFPDGVRWRRVLIKSAAKSASELLRTGTHSFYSTYGKLIQRKFAPDNFYLVDGGIAIFYSRGDIAPPSEGIPAFVTQLPA